MSGAAAAARSAVAARAGGPARRTIEQLLGYAGLGVNGDAAWDLRVHDTRFFERVLAHGSLGLGESYVEGWWDCDRLDEFACRALRAGIDRHILGWSDLVLLVWARCRNLQTLARARVVAERHYDLGNAFFARMLGPTMTYSCAYWRSGDDLEAAQEAKMDLVARKLRLRPADRVLDIGCGWGGMARYAAERYGCQVVGITISQRQHEWAKSWLRGTSARVLLLDYRSPELGRLGPFDKILSIGAFEHIGRRNYRRFAAIVSSLLEENGLFLLHTIVNDHAPAEPWINTYVFPNGMLPSHADLASMARGSFVVEDMHHIGPDYDRTLLAWHANCARYAAEPDFPYPTRFQRMWRYYLLTCAGSFRARRNHVCQILLSKGGVPGGLDPVR
jgi:cyclopropane-fatty-acyl-phospholipid synthase